MKNTSMFLLLLSSLSLAMEFEKAENFKLENYDGKTYELNEFKDSKAIVLMFIATRCPVSNAYNARMVSLYEDYTGKGVQFLAVNSNTTEDVQEIKKHAGENGLLFPVLKDEYNVIADLFNASVTPEVYVLNPDLHVLYHGRIDDSRRENDVKSQDLRAALDLVLQGKEVPTKETKAFGCTIKRVAK